MQAGFEGRSVTLFDINILFGKGEKDTHHKWKGDVKGEYVNECKGYDWVTKDTYF